MELVLEDVTGGGCITHNKAFPKAPTGLSYLPPPPPPSLGHGQYGPLPPLVLMGWCV